MICFRYFGGPVDAGGLHWISSSWKMPRWRIRQKMCFWQSLELFSIIRKIVNMIEWNISCVETDRTSTPSNSYFAKSQEIDIMLPWHMANTNWRPAESNKRCPKNNPFVLRSHRNYSPVLQHGHKMSSATSKRLKDDWTSLIEKRLPDASTGWDLNRLRNLWNI